MRTAVDESSKNLTSLPSGYKLAVVYNANLLSNMVRLRFGMFSDGSHKIWNKVKTMREEYKAKKLGKTLSVQQEEDQLIDLKKQAELACSALEVYTLFQSHSLRLKKHVCATIYSKLVWVKLKACAWGMHERVLFALS